MALVQHTAVGWHHLGSSTTTTRLGPSIIRQQCCQQLFVAATSCPRASCGPRHRSPTKLHVTPHKPHSVTTQRKMHKRQLRRIQAPGAARAARGQPPFDLASSPVNNDEINMHKHAVFDHEQIHQAPISGSISAPKAAADTVRTGQDGPASNQCTKQCASLLQSVVALRLRPVPPSMPHHFAPAMLQRRAHSCGHAGCSSP